MNIFQKNAAEKHGPESCGHILTVWTNFKVAVVELLESYNNEHPRGAKCPANISESSSTSIVIDCPQEAGKGQFSVKIITIRASLEQAYLTISCAIETWVKSPVLGASTANESRVVMKFVLDPDNKSVLLREEKMKPFEAAERLLFTALIPH